MEPLRGSGDTFARLSTQQLDRMHAASLEVMERSGVRFLDESALEVFAQGGCEVEGTRVRFPPKLVEWALEVCPKALTVYDQEGQPRLELTGRSAYYGNGSDLLYIIDHRTGERREPVLQDLRDTMRVMDALPDMDFVMSGFIPRDVPADAAQRWQMTVMMEETSKPIVYVTTDLANAQVKVAMAEVEAGGAEALRERPFAVCYINISNPLRHNPESIRKLMWLSQRQLPFIYRPSVVTRGISTPITWAGFLVVNNVSGLAGLVLSQLVREGAPFIRCGTPGGTFDMKTMVGQQCSPEIRGFNEDMAEYYDLPRFGLGGATASKVVDQQAALEAAFTLMSAAQAGGQLIHDVGYMDNGTTGALDQLVICHEMIGWVKQYLKELVVDEETLALDLIHEIVEKDGAFLDSEHTYRHFREDQYPELIDRANFETWEAAGATTLKARAGEKVDEILAGHRPRRLPDETLAALQGIVERGVTSS